MELNRMRALTTAAKIERIAYFLLACTVAFFTNRELCRGHDASEDVPVFIPVVEFTPFAGEFLRDALRGVFTFFVVMVGLGTVAVPSGIMASALTEAKERR